VGNGLTLPRLVGRCHAWLFSRQFARTQEVIVGLLGVGCARCGLLNCGGCKSRQSGRLLDQHSSRFRHAAGTAGAPEEAPGREVGGSESECMLPCDALWPTPSSLPSRSAISASYGVVV